MTASNQTTFQHTWRPTTDDLGPNDFAVFVYTQFPVPGLEVTENSIRQVDVKCFSAPREGAARVAAANTCSDTWVGSSRFVAPGQLEINAQVTWQRDPKTPEIDGDVSYIATGTATVKWLQLESEGCSTSKSVFGIAGDYVADNNFLLVEYGEKPPLYNGAGEILLLTTVSCPNRPAFDYPLVGLWFLGVGKLSTDGMVIQGRNDAGNGVYWEWTFRRP